MDVVSTVLNVAASAVSAVEASAPPFGAGAIAPPLSLAWSGLGSRLGSFCVVHCFLLSGRRSSAAAKDRTISSRPGTGARAFSHRTSETPERCETMNSGGTLRPRALARSSTCFGERMVSAMMSSRAETEALQRGDRGGSHRANAARRGRPRARSRALDRRSRARAWPDRAAPCAMSLTASTRSKPCGEQLQVVFRGRRAQAPAP